MNPFDYISDASYAKKNIMRGTENDTLAEKGYNPYISNLAFSYHPDSILHANLMNQYHELPNRAQYEFYIHSLRPKKRFAKWVKNIDNDDLTAVCEYYKCNINVGKEYLSLLSKEQLAALKSEQDVGGTSKT